MGNTQVLKHFFEMTSEAMLVTDDDGHIIQCNPTAQRFIDMTGQNLATPSMQSTTEPQDVDLLEDAIKRVSNHQQPTKIALRLNCKSLKTVWIEWNMQFDEALQTIYWVGHDVTEFKRKEAFLEILEEVTGTGVWELESDGEVIHWSSKIHDIHQTDQMTYTPHIDTALSFYADEAIPPLVEALEHQDKTGKPYSLNLPFITAKKRNITVNARGFAQKRDGVVLRRYGTFKDISEEAKSELEKQKLANRMNLALDASNIGVWEFDYQEELLVWDTRMFDIYAVSPDNFHGTMQDWVNIIHPEDHRRFVQAFLNAQSGSNNYQCQFRIIADNGEVKFIKGMGTNVFNHDGKLTHTIGVDLDITEEVKQRQLLELAKEKSEAADRAKSRFLATMSHEIRTPLNGIMGSLQLLKSGAVKEQQNTIVDQSLSSAKSLLHIINDILDYTKITENKIELEYLPVDIKALVQQIIDEQGSIEKDVIVQPLFHENVAPFYIADPTRLRQIMTNLVSNALKFTSVGTVSIYVKSIKHEEKQALQIKVEDTGIGMSVEQQKHIFDPFQQADSSITRKFGGTGLGLSIVKQLTDLMNGSMTVESHVDKGTCFNLIFPFKNVDSEEEKKTDDVALINLNSV